MIGLFASIFPIGGILGPNLGGAIIEHFGWREIFLVNVPIGVAGIGLLARQAIPRRPDDRAPRDEADGGPDGHGHVRDDGGEVTTHLAGTAGAPLLRVTHRGRHV
jgi:MFS family permease